MSIQIKLLLAAFVLSLIDMLVMWLWVTYTFNPLVFAVVQICLALALASGLCSVAIVILRKYKEHDN
jgi:xanthine/uracil permease